MIQRTILLMLLLLATACAAPGDTLYGGSVLRSMDNDSLDRSDDQYTSGFAVSYIGQPRASFAQTPLPREIADAVEEHWPFRSHDQRFVIYSLSHRIFTPTDLSATEVVEGDLPYSALLYGTATAVSQGPDELAAAGLSVGWVGPLALGEPIQSTIHDVLGFEDPKGWDHQLEHEPLVNVAVELRRRMLRLGGSEGLGSDLLGAASLSAGNLQTQATAAATLRVGLRLPSNFHMHSSFLSEESLGLRSYERASRRLSAYAFAGVAGTLLANAIYLDGNTFSDGPSVDHDHGVLRGSAGVVLEYKRLLASLSFERATLPWDHPEGLDEESYLRFGISWDF